MSELNKQQKKNYIRCLDNECISYNQLENLIGKSEVKKQAILDFFGGKDTLEYSKPYTNDELVQNNNLLFLLTNKYSEYSFTFTAKNVTERTTGKCTSLKTFLKDHFYSELQINDILHTCNQSRQLFISCNPYFILGQSVVTYGRQLDSSCHYPGSSHPYTSGPISYALDTFTIIFGSWSNGLSGRQLVHLDIENKSLITSRLYGDFKDSDSTYLRKQLYKLFSTPDWRKAKNEYIQLNSSHYRGYLDSDCFTLYRHAFTHSSLTLPAPICLNCGNDTDLITCTDCKGERCSNCDCTGLSQDETYWENDHIYCETCYWELFSCCSCCGETFDHDEVFNCDGEYYCEYCAKRKGFYKCYECEEMTSIDEMTTFNDDGYCEHCFNNLNVSYCDKCNEYREGEMVEFDGENYCEDCAKDNNIKECSECNNLTDEDLLLTEDNTFVCIDCADDNYPGTCAACGKRLILECSGACSSICATNTLFNTTTPEIFINIRRHEQLIKVKSYYRTTVQDLTLHVTKSLDNPNKYTITEYTTGQTASSWECDTIQECIALITDTHIGRHTIAETIQRVETPAYKGAN